MLIRERFRLAAMVAAGAAFLALILVSLDLLVQFGEAGAQLGDTGIFRLADSILPHSAWGYGGPIADVLHQYYSFDAPHGWWGFFAMAFVANTIVAAAGALAVSVLFSLLQRSGGQNSSRRPGRLSSAFRYAAAGVLFLAVLSLGWTAARHLRLVPGRHASHPNVLLVSIDTLRADHLSAYGYDRETSPNIDILAAEGALFQQAISPSSWTLPTHATMLTGIPSPHHGLNSDQEKLSASVVTLAEVFFGAGYQTAAFVSAPYLNPRYGFDQGFELYDNSADSDEDVWNLITSPALETLAVDWLDKWSGEEDRKPFFAFLHMWDPHASYIPPSPYDEMFNPGYEGDLTGENLRERLGPARDGELSEHDVEHLLALYDGEIRFTDHHLGRILARLAELGELDNTVIVVTADHGEEFFDHGRVGHAMNLYDETVQIPLIIRYPAKVRPGTVVEEQVRTMDIPVTLLSLAGVTLPESFGLKAEGVEYRGVDLSNWIEQRPLLPQLPSHGDLRGNIKSLRTETRKFVYEAKFNYPQYFHLIEDPDEQKNLARKGTERTAALRRQIERFAETEVRPGLAEPTLPDEKHLDRLRTLGYIN